MGSNREEIKKSKKTAPGRIRTLILQNMRHELYHYATTAVLNEMCYVRLAKLALSLDLNLRVKALESLNTKISNVPNTDWFGNVLYQLGR